MAATEQLDWSQSDKPDKKKKEPSESRFSNPPIKGMVEHDLPLHKGREVSMKMEERVLPDTLFNQLINGEGVKKHEHETEADKEHAKAMAHVPIPVEQVAPPAARAEHPVYDPFQAEQAAHQTKPVSEFEHDAEADEDEDDDEDDEKKAERREATAHDADETIAVPLDEAHEGSIPTKQADAVERLIDLLEDETAISEAQGDIRPIAEDTAEPVVAEARSTGPFMPLESEPEGAAEAATYAEQEPAPPVASSAGGGGTRPPVPPSEAASSFPDFEPTPPPSAPQPSFNRYYQPASEQPLSPRTETYANALPANYAEVRTRPKSDEAELRAKITWGVTGFVVGNYLARRRQQRFEAEADKRMQEANQRFAEVSSDNALLQQRMDRMPAAVAPTQYEQQQPYGYNQVPIPAPTAQYEQPAYPQQPLQEQYPLTATFSTPRSEQIAATGQPVHYEQPLQQQFERPPAPSSGPAEIAQPQQMAEQMPQVVGEDGQQVVLEPGQRLERRGWYSVVVDEHGREVQGAIKYGGAMHAEQRQEQGLAAFTAVDAASDQDPAQRQQQAQAADTAGASLGGGGSAPASYAGGSYGPAINPSSLLSSGQADPSHSLDSKGADLQHRLSQRQNPIIATLSNPVLWLAFALLVIAYFIAALL